MQGGIITKSHSQWQGVPIASLMTQLFTSSTGDVVVFI